MLNAPGLEKKNPFTDLIHEVNRINREGGALAGRGGGTPIVQGGPLVRSAEVNRPPDILSPEEYAERDRLAREIGILPPSEEEPPAYPTWESAAKIGREDIINPVAFQGSAREYIGETKNELPRLIDFKKIQGIDLILNCVYVDGFRIPLPEETVKQYKQDVLNLAVNFVTQQLAEALAEITFTKEQLSETMQRMPDDQGKEPLQSENGITQETTEPLQTVSGESQSSMAEKQSESTESELPEIQPVRKRGRKRLKSTPQSE